MFSEIKRNLENCLINPQTIENDPKIAENLIKTSISFAKGSLSGRKQWEIVDLSHQLSQHLEQDLTLSIGDQIVKSNSLFLTTLSPFFKAMLHHPLKESSDFSLGRTITLEADDSLANLLQGTLSTNNILNIMQTADIYGLHPLDYPITEQLHKFDDESIKYILNNLPEDLNTLNLSQFESKELVDLKRFPELKRFKTLKTLICTGCKNAIYHVNIKQAFPNLEELDISDSPKLSTLPLMPKLKKLTINGCQKLKIESLTHFLMKHNDLTDFEFNYPNTSEYNEMLENVKASKGLTTI